MFSASHSAHRNDGSSVSVTTLARPVLALVLLATLGCSAEGPTGPSLISLPYDEDASAYASHQLKMMGFDGVARNGPNGPIVPACVGLGVSGLAWEATATVMVRRIGAATWRVVPATSKDGSFELYLHAAHGTKQLDVPVTGTIRGFLKNTVAPDFGVGDVRVTFDSDREGAIPVEGAVLNHGLFAHGTIGGG